MKTSLLLVLVTGMFLVLTAGSCLRGKHIVGSKNYISKEVKADHFNEIKLVGSANIQLLARHMQPCRNSWFRQHYTTYRNVCRR